MSQKVKIELDSKEISKLLRGEWSKELVKQFASNVASRAGDGYSCSTHDSGQRQIANVFAETNAAKRDNLKNNTLVKALG